MKGKKLLAGVLSAAMLLSTAALPAFAEDSSTEMTYGEFLQKMQKSQYDCDFEGATIKIETDMFCTDTNHDDSCTYTDYRGRAAEAPGRIQGTNAQYQLFDKATDVTIKNAKFVANKTKGVGLHLTNNNDWQGEIAAGKDLNVELQFQNSGNLTIEGCEFDGLNVAPYHTGSTTAAGTVDSFKNNKFSNVYNAYGIQGIYSENVIADGNSFENCNGGIYLEGAKKDVTISNNTFNKMGENATEAKKQTAGCIQLSAQVSSDASISIISNTSDGTTPALRQLSEVAEVITANNDFGGSSELTKTENSDGVDQNEIPAIAQIGDKYYKTLKDAVAAANDKDTVTLLCDASGDGIVVNPKQNGLKDLTINFNGFTYTVNGTLVGSGGSKTNCFQLLAGANTADPVNVVFENGTIVSSKLAKWGEGTKYNDIYTGANIIVQNYSNLTLKDMTIDGDQSDKDEGNPSSNYALYVLSNNNGNTVLTGNTNIIAAPGRYAFDVCRYADYPGVIVTLDDKMTGTITGKIEISNSDKAGNVEIPPVSNDGFNLIIKAGNIDGKIYDRRTAKQKAAYAKIGAISGGTFDTDVSAYCADGFKARFVNGKFVVDEDNSADTVTLKFEPASENVYDIVLSGNGAVINRLNVAEFKFDMSNPAVSYEIKAADKLTTLQPDVDKYVFYFDGKDDINGADTAADITIGTVTFDGVGTFTFAATAGKVTDTTMKDNLVNEFVVDGATGKGTLVIDDPESIINGNITIPSHMLTVNVLMNHSIGDNAADYQNMAVAISGGDLAGQVLTYNLGDAGNAAITKVTNANDKVISYRVKTKLSENRLYTVTVTGAGYRTARYTVTMNDNKTMNVWNNAMSEDTVVVDKTKAMTNFLAGDIVKDGNVNIYDLSAVVAYFGTDNLVTDHPTYAKYDLNRDGVIDMMDISIVLTSWGK